MAENNEIKDYRLDTGITRGKEIEITVNGKSMRAFEGETIGAALAAAGVRAVRHAPQHKDPRGLYCCMGSCHGCLVTVDGQPNVRACITPIERGQRIELQDGLGQVDMDSPPPAAGRWIREKIPLVIIGGGPAGLSAAIAAAQVGTRVLVIDENQQARRAVLGKVDARCRSIPGYTTTFDIDTVCIGYGLIPSVWLTRMLGCRHVYDPALGGWVPYSDGNLQTDQPGVFVAGDGAGIAGVLVARREGTIAGLYAAVHAGIISPRQAEQAVRAERKKLASLRRFRRGLDQMYRIFPDLYAHNTDNTIVCRCEGVTAGEIRKAIRAGTTSLNDIKKRSRAGMGYCQGTHCMPVIAAMLAREFGVNPEAIKMMTTRPPARPIPLSLLMS